jgi:hypothetical protein
MPIPHSSPSRPSFTARVRLLRPTPRLRLLTAHLPSAGTLVVGSVVTWRSRLHHGEPHLPALSPRTAQPPARWHPPSRHSVASSSVLTSSFASTSLHLSKQQVDATLKAHVARVYFKYFRCFWGMLQVLYIDVAKVDRDVAHVPMSIHMF